METPEKLYQFELKEWEQDWEKKKKDYPSHGPRSQWAFDKAMFEPNHPKSEFCNND